MSIEEVHDLVQKICQVTLNMIVIFLHKITTVALVPGGGGGGTQKSFIRGGSAPRSNPLPFYIPFFSEKAPLSYTFHWKKAPLSYTFLRINR